MGTVVTLRRGRGTTPPNAPGFVAFRPGPRGFGALGLAPVGGQVVSKAASVGVGYEVSQFAALGSAAGPIGTVVGAIVGLAVGALLTKNYLNVAQANAAEDQAVQVFNQYRTIAGQIPGRQLGLESMHAVFLGAVYSGVFPLNNQVKTFHEGALKYPGNPDWVYGVLYNGANNPYTFAWALQQLKGMRGSIPAGMPEAAVLVDQFFIPSNTHDSPAWAVPQSPLAHQVLYDAADAYLSQNAGFITTPLVTSQASAAIANAPQPSGAAILPAASSTTLPAVVPTSAGTYAVVPASPGMMQTAVILPGTAGANLSPYATPILPATPAAIAAAAGTVTPVNAATSANLDAAMAAQGYTRAGTSTSGYPLYSQAGQVYAYANGQLFPFSSVAQLAATGNAGTGAAIPSTGLDPNVLAAIQAAVASGVPPQQAAYSAAANLQAQGVPITPTTQDQLLNAASVPASSLLSGNNLLLVLAGLGVVLFLATRSRT